MSDGIYAKAGCGNMCPFCCIVSGGDACQDNLLAQQSPERLYPGTRPLLQMKVLNGF